MPGGKGMEKSNVPKKISRMFLYLSFSSTLSMMLSQSYLMFFVTEYTGVSVVAIASVLAGVRLVDLIVSLFAGTVVQKSNSKHGHYRPWMAWCQVLSCIGYIICFLNPDVDPGVKVVIICIGYILGAIPSNFRTAAQQGLMAEIAGPNMGSRLELTSRLMQGMQAARLLSAATTLPLVNLFQSMDQNGYLCVMIIHSAVAISGVIVMLTMTKEYDKYDPNAKNVEGAAVTAKVSQIYGQTLKNPQMWALLIADILKSIGLEAVTALSIYYFRYSCNNINYMTISMTIANIVGLVAAVIVPSYARKIGKRGSYMFANLTAVVAYLVIALFTDGKPYLYMTMSALATLGLAVYGVFGFNMYLDAAEYQLYKTGLDSRPFVMSLNMVQMKVGMMTSSYITAFALNMGGYVEGSGVTNTGRFVFWVGMVPVIMYLASTFVFKFCYKITDEQAAQYAESNRKMMTERAVKAGDKMMADNLGTPAK